MSAVLTLLAPAKINWSLAVLGKRPDGYHELSGIMQNISLYDRVTLSPDNKDACFCDPDPCSGGDNLALRAWQLMREHYHLSGGLHISIEKHIPAGGGLGGGSADAAAVILGVAQLFGLNATKKELAELSFRLGADLPFCITGGAAIVKGAGEEVLPFEPEYVWELFLICPKRALSTASVFAAFDNLAIQYKNNDTKTLRKALNSGDIQKVAANACNMLEPAAISLDPAIGEIKNALTSVGCFCLMSGSGSCLWAICPTDMEQDAENYLLAQGIGHYRISTLSEGIKII